MDPRAILEGLTGIGERQCEPTADDMVKLCAALLYIHGDFYSRRGRSVSTQYIYGSSAIKESAELLAKLSPEQIVAQLREGLDRLDRGPAVPEHWSCPECGCGICGQPNPGQMCNGCREPLEFRGLCECPDCSGTGLIHGIGNREAPCACRERRYASP